MNGFMWVDQTRSEASSTEEPDRLTTLEISSAERRKWSLRGIQVPDLDTVAVKGILFVDAGRGFLSPQTINFSTLAASVGFGVWWFSPFGPVKFEFGFPVKKQSTDQTSVFDFAIGSTF